MSRVVVHKTLVSLLIYNPSTIATRYYWLMMRSAPFYKMIENSLHFKCIINYCVGAIFYFYKMLDCFVLQKILLKKIKRRLSQETLWWIHDVVDDDDVKRRGREPLKYILLSYFYFLKGLVL